MPTLCVPQVPFDIIRQTRGVLRLRLEARKEVEAVQYMDASVHVLNLDSVGAE